MGLPEQALPEEARVTQQRCKMCLRIYLLWISIAVGSLVVGLWRTFMTSDEGKGFTDAAYVVAVGGVILFPIQNRHNQRCQESKRNEA